MLSKYATIRIWLNEADIPEDRLVYAEVMYDVFLMNKKTHKKNTTVAGF